ncbi:MAG: BACON domain-containing protein [Puniceicoccales bacterium]|jgi:hypothetical protein|nr:BACON domain-containing protein [Puniceicoccales bacterium]
MNNKANSSSPITATRKSFARTSALLLCALALGVATPRASDVNAAPAAATASAEKPAPKVDTRVRKFSLSSKKVEISDLGNPRVFRVSSNKPWTIDCGQKWLSVSQKSGDAGWFQIDVSATKNESKTERKSKLTVRSDGSVIEVEVIQGKAGDYWNDGEILWINKHKKGKGVPILIVGDGFDRQDLKKGGYWETAARTLVSVLRSVMVIRDLWDDHLDVGIFMAESKERGLESRDHQHAIPPRKSRFGGRQFGEANYRAVRHTLEKAHPEGGAEIRFCFVANAPFGGWAYLHNNAFVSVTAVGGGYWSVHEFFGHAFAGLPDLYHTGTDWAYKAAEGVDFTNDPEKVKWKPFLKRKEYVRDGVGFHKHGKEGNVTIWVAEDHRRSAMTHNTGYFTALERYQIWKRIKRLAGEDYSVEAFFKYDIPRNVGKSSKTPLWNAQTPPIIRPWWHGIWEKPLGEPKPKTKPQPRHRK